MNFNIDSKALVKTQFLTPNTSFLTAKQTVEANIARIGFAQTLAQLQTRQTVNSSTILNPQVPSVAVKEGDTLCIIEAMKILNEIESDKAGVVKQVLCENGQAVEYGQTLYIIE